MEVHAHTHTARKKWTHYFWEFLMLFLAVTLGFFVENQREHYIEHQREKQYMRSMVEDLLLDTAEFNSKLTLIDSFLVPALDTSKKIIFHKGISGNVIKELYEFVPLCWRFLDVYTEDRTMSQLKSSGNLRLIRNKTVTDSLAAYWKVLGLLSNTLLRSYELSRIEVKNITYGLFNFKYYGGHNPFTKQITDTSLQLVSDNKQEFIKLANFISNLYNQANGPIKERIKEARERAMELIAIIRNKYHFE